MARIHYCGVCFDMYLQTCSQDSFVEYVTEWSCIQSMLACKVGLCAALPPLPAVTTPSLLTIALGPKLVSASFYTVSHKSFMGQMLPHPSCAARYHASMLVACTPIILLGLWFDMYLQSHLQVALVLQNV